MDLQHPCGLRLHKVRAVTSRQVVLDLHGGMEHAEDIDITVGLDQVGDAIVLEQKNANVPIRMRLIPIANFGKLFEAFRTFVNGENCPRSCALHHPWRYRQKSIPATGLPQPSTSVSPRTNPLEHILMADRAPSIGVSQASFYHVDECQLTE